MTAPSADGLPEEGEEETDKGGEQTETSSSALADGLEKKEEIGKEEETPKAGLFSRLGSIVSGAFGGGVTAPSADGLPEEGEEEEDKEEEKTGTSSTALADGLEKKEEIGKEEETPKAGLFSRLGSIVSGAFGGGVTAPSADGLPEEGEEETDKEEEKTGTSSTALADGLEKKEEIGKEEETQQAGLFSRLGSIVSGAFGGGVTAPSAEGLPEEGEEETDKEEEKTGTSSTALADGLEKKEETDKEGEAPQAGFFSRLGSIVSGAFGGGVTAPSADGLPEEGEEEADKGGEAPQAGFFSRLGSALSGAFDKVITSPDKEEEAEDSSSALADGKEGEAPKAGLFSRLGVL